MPVSSYNPSSYTPSSYRTSSYVTSSYNPSSYNSSSSFYLSNYKNNSNYNPSTLYSETASILSFPMSEFTTSHPLVQRIKKLWSVIFEGKSLKFNQQRCLRILQRIYSIHLSIKEIKENAESGEINFLQENIYDFDELKESLNE